MPCDPRPSRNHAYPSTIGCLSLQTVSQNKPILSCFCILSQQGEKQLMSSLSPGGWSGHQDGFCTEAGSVLCCVPVSSPLPSDCSQQSPAGPHPPPMRAAAETTPFTLPGESWGAPQPRRIQEDPSWMGERGLQRETGLERAVGPSIAPRTSGNVLQEISCSSENP